MFKRGSLKKESAVNGFGREDMQNKKGNYGKQKRKPFLKDFLFVRCLAESNRSTRFCRPLPNRSVKTPCRVFCLQTPNRCLIKLSRCLAESNRSTRFCRPLPNRSVKTPCRVLVTISDKRVQRYYFFLNPPNLSASFFEKYSNFSKIFIFSIQF